jgi:hypothetical protein
VFGKDAIATAEAEAAWTARCAFIDALFDAQGAAPGDEDVVAADAAALDAIRVLLKTKTEHLSGGAGRGRELSYACVSAAQRLYMGYSGAAIDSYAAAADAARMRTRPVFSFSDLVFDAPV